MIKTKYIFYSFWLLLLAFPVFVIFNATTDLQRVFASNALTLNFFQRMVGLMALTLLPLQIILGGFMNRLTEKWGGWVFTFHITQAILIYTLIFLHPVLFMLSVRKGTFGIDPFYVFTDFCILCKTKFELYYTIGRVSFWLVTLGYLVGKFRTHPVLQKHWHKFHILNYVTYFLIALHAYLVGSDIQSKYFYPYFTGSLIVVAAVLLYKLYNLVKGRFKPTF